jgi:alcohol dehydrogenase class IV
LIRLSQVKVEADDLQSCAELALTDGATSTNPRALRSSAEIVAVYRQAF